MQTSLEIPKEITERIVSHASPVVLCGTFAITSHYWRSLAHQSMFVQICKNSQEEKQLSFLTHLYLNYHIVTHPAAQTIAPSWCNHLNTYRKSHGITLLNRLLATALLKILNNNHEPNLTNEFKTLLHFFAQNDRQLANSILAVLMQAKGNNTVYDLCKTDHSLQDIFSSHAEPISISIASLLVKPFAALYSSQGGLGNITNNPHNIERHPINFTLCMRAIIKTFPDTHFFWKNPDNSVRNIMYYLSRFPRYLTVDLLVDIQIRLRNKDFLNQYYEDIVGLVTEDKLSTTINEAILCVKNSEDDYLTYLKTYYKKLFDFRSDETNPIITITNFVRKLTSEKNIIEGLDHFCELLIKKSHPFYFKLVTETIALTFPKIKSQSLLFDNILKVFHMNYVPFHYKETADLASICTLSPLNHNTMAALLEHFFNFYKTASGSMLQHKMTAALCWRIKSKPFAETWANNLSSMTAQIKTESGAYFEHPNNYMYLECYLIFLKKTESEATFDDFMHKLLLINTELDQAISRKYSDAITVVLQFIKCIKSDAIRTQWIDAIYKNRPYMDENQFADLYKIPKNQRLMEYELNRYVTTSPTDYFVRKSCHMNVGYLLLNAPAELSERLTQMIFNLPERDIPIPLSIKTYAKSLDEAAQEQISKGPTS